MFEPTYVNPSRRDLLKKLAAIGALGLTSPLVSACRVSESNARTTWRRDGAYESLRKRMLYKANTPARYPDVIVQPKTEEGVLEALAFARSEDLQIVCRASRHNTAILRA